MAFIGQKLNGQCIRSVRSGSAINAISMHILMGTKKLLDVTKSRIFLCNNNYEGGYKYRGIPASSPAGGNGNQPLPYAAFYGSSGMQRPGKLLPNEDWNFDLLELSEWFPKLIKNPDFIGQPDNQEFKEYYAEGPRLEYAKSYMRIKERDQVKYPFENINSISWTKYDPSIYDYDWLGNLMPGGWCFTNRNITEPLLGYDYYEDARKPSEPIPIINRNGRLIQEDWFPFCNRISVFSKKGVRLGWFDGITMMAFFNAAAVKNPMKPPLDRTLYPDLENKTPSLNPERQILNLEVWFYLTGIGIKSPRVATIRFWTYTKGISYLDSGSNDLPFNPYMFMNAQKDCDIYIKAKILKNSNNPNSLEEIGVKIPLSSLHFFIGA